MKTMSFKSIWNNNNHATSRQSNSHTSAITIINKRPHLGTESLRVALDQQRKSTICLRPEEQSVLTRRLFAHSAALPQAQALKDNYTNMNNNLANGGVCEQKHTQVKLSNNKLMLSKQRNKRLHVNEKCGAVCVKLADS